MEYKDTILRYERLCEIDAHNAQSNFTDALYDVAKEQAEIAFKAGEDKGKQEGIKEVVDDMEQSIERAKPRFIIAAMLSCLEKWQAKLKEWGLG